MSGETQTPLAIGQAVGHYVIEKKLGQGGIGIVYRARDISLDRRVALKVLGERARADENAWGRMLVEARTASALSHPCICTIHEVGEEEGLAYLAMEYVAGQTVRTLIPPGGLPLDRALAIGSQVAEALAYAHANGIVHRDVKSSNVMVTPEGRVKVLDFGLARRLVDEQLTTATKSHSSLNEMPSLAGTLPYLAPEILYGKPADVQSDLWALGILLHEMLTGDLPFRGQTPFELSTAIMVGKPAPLPAQVPKPVRSIVERCLERNRSRRYQHVSEVAEALGAQQAAYGADGAYESRSRRLLRTRVLPIALALGGIGAALGLWSSREHFLPRREPAPTVRPMSPAPVKHR